MDSILLCKDDHCPLKTRCHRFKSTPQPNQKYFIMTPLQWNERESFHCDEFWEVME